MSNYNTYDFDPETPFIPLKGCECNVDMDEIKKTINDTLDESLCRTNCHITCSTNQIIKEIRDNKTEVCLCGVAAKNDIKEAIKEINKHTDEKFNEIDFISQFDNLNNQLKNLQNEK